MLSSAARLTTTLSRASAIRTATRGFAAPKLEEANKSVEYAWKKSCYSGIDYTISDDASVYEAVEKFAAYGVG